MTKQNKNLYIGCGPDIREGFLHSDLREFPHVDFVCKSWEISTHVQGLEHIYTRHMLEHLTIGEVEYALRDWLKALAPGGSVRIVVPNMDYHCEQWLRAEWNEETESHSRSDAMHSAAGFWGWQAECDPTQVDYNNSYWDVHKSGFNQKRIRYVLEKIGFVQVQTEVKSNIHLVAEAVKPQ